MSSWCCLWSVKAQLRAMHRPSASLSLPRQKNGDLKQKIVIYYEQLFAGDGVDPSLQHPSFWDELFYLWANAGYLEERVNNMTGQQLLRQKPLFNLLADTCINTVCMHNNVQTVNAINTLMAVIRGLARRAGLGFDVIDVLFGVHCAEMQMKKLIERLCALLIEEQPNVLKKLALDGLLCLATVTDDIAKNALLDYFLNASVFEAVTQLLMNAASRQVHGDRAVLLLTLLVSYRKNENINPYIVKLSILDDELALNGYSHVISTALAEHNRKLNNRLSQSESTGMFSTVSNIVGTMFVADDIKLNNVKSDDRLLLAMYEAVHLNRNFITTLTSLPTQLNGGEETASGSADEMTNLFVAFLTYCSVVMQDLKTERIRDAAKLCFIILTCISEDQYANSVMHDVNMAFRIPLYRAPMRHRKGAFDKGRPLRPLVVTVLDLLCEFISSHLMRQLPHELYCWALGVVHRIICYEKKCRVRLQYDWRGLWNALISLLRFVVQQEALLVPSCDIFLLSLRVVTIINLFITFGDTFLPDPVTYDHLYYEVLRQADAFEALQLVVQRYLTEDSPYKDSASKLVNQLLNVRGIIAHLQPKISQLGATSLTEHQVLTVVRESYDSLSLKLYEYLDVVDRYEENPRQSAFFSGLVKAIVSDTQQTLHNDQLEQSRVLHELSSIV